MISFTVLTDENESEILALASSLLPEADTAEISDILASFTDFMDEDVEIAVGASHGCLLIRIFDLEYLFPYPIAMSDTADEISAANEIRCYALKEEIPLTFIDTPEQSLAALISLFRYADVEAEDFERSSYTVRAKNELSLLDGIPTLCEGEISLSPLTTSDSPLYTRLAQDKEHNKYWGYDYSLDCVDADGEYFLKTASEEWSREVSLSLAIRYCGEFIGELIFYAFDFLGGAEVALRLLPEKCGKGYGSKALNAAVLMAKKLDILSLYATVKNANSASASLFGRRMEVYEQNQETTRFYLKM